MEIEQMRIRMGEMAAEIERLNSAWQVETLNRKDLIIAKQESENDRLKAENARLQSIIDSQSPDKTEYVPISCDMKSVFIDGFGLLPIQYPGDQQSPAVEVPDYKEELFQLRKKAENLSTKLGFIVSVINSRKISLSTKEREFPHLLIERLHTDS